jgi:hypothetical protein
MVALSSPWHSDATDVRVFVRFSASCTAVAVFPYSGQTMAATSGQRDTS